MLDVPVADVDARESRLRDAVPAAALPRAGTSEGRQLRRWLTQLMVTERVIAAEAAAAGLTAVGAPSEDELLPDNSARLEIGSVAAAALADPLARAMFVARDGRPSTSPTADVADYHARNPLRFAAPSDAGNGWRTATAVAPPLDAVRPLIVEHLRGAARRRAFRLWLDARRAELVRLAPGYEHPGRPASARQHPQALMSDQALAIDIGGTKIAVGLVGDDGHLGHHAQLPTPDERRRGHLGGGRLAGHRGAGRRGWSRPRRRDRVGGSDRSAVGHRQPDQYHAVATLSDRRASD